MAINADAAPPPAADAAPSPAADAAPSPAATPPFDAANVDTTPPVPLVNAAAPVGATPKIAVSLSVPNPADLADPNPDSSPIPTPQGIKGESKDEGADKETSCPSIVRMVKVMKSSPLHLALLFFLAIFPDVNVNRFSVFKGEAMLFAIIAPPPNTSDTIFMHWWLLVMMFFAVYLSFSFSRGYELVRAHIPSGVWLPLLLAYAIVLFYTSATFRHPLKTLPLGKILTFKSWVSLYKADRLRRISPKFGFDTV